MAEKLQGFYGAPMSHSDTLFAGLYSRCMTNIDMFTDIY